ncbi:MAG: prepilin-type N-terminal cleavage/methylation domain-containing protein [Phycisphaerales bacterium]|nr:prepilin-type N-terminal cleavage/methylation domain-containing protein [Phycisphaerales bacterium]
MKRNRLSAFTLIELLVVVAIIALLLSILLPSLAGAREQGKRAVCLSNLSGLGKAMWQYAGEYPNEPTIPIHMKMVMPSEFWLWRTANWFAWGGVSGDQVFRIADEAGWLLDELGPNEVAPDGSLALPEYDATRRPLTNFITGGQISQKDDKKLEWFRCPSDTGYPDDPDIDDAPPANSERPCYRTLGNSYRGSLASLAEIAGGGAAPSTKMFSRGPWGTRISTLVDTSRLVWVGEPTWFNMIGRDSPGGVQGEVDVFGWHKRKLTDNLLFVDGSARSTKAEYRTQFDDETIIQMKVVDKRYLGRFGNVRIDTYPVGGARIFGDWSQSLSSPLWPFANFQNNHAAP